MYRFVPLLALILMLAACSPHQPALVPDSDPTQSPAAGPDSTVSNPGLETPVVRKTAVVRPNPYAPQPGDKELLRGNAFVESANLLVSESYPPQYSLTLQGNLPSPCHDLRVALPVEAEAGKLNIEVYSVIAEDVICIQVLEPFEVFVPLNYPAGQYSLWVNGEQIGKMDAPETSSEPLAFKGMELYSWQENGAWFYSLLPGTNRNKTAAEISDPAVTFSDLAVLKERLARLAPGEQIFWLGLDDPELKLTLPSQEVIAELQAYCEGLELNLMVSP